MREKTMSLLLLGGGTLLVILVILFFVHRMKISEGFKECVKGIKSSSTCGSCRIKNIIRCPDGCNWDSKDKICYDS